MPIMDSSTKRFLSMLLAPVLLAANGKFGLGIDKDTQQMLIELIGAYILTSKGGEVLIEQAVQKAKIAAAQVQHADVTNVLNRAAEKGASL